jgi:hypothetical protein
MKVCFTCRAEKPYSEFNINKSRKSGYSADCKECHKEYNRQWYHKNRKRLIEKERARKRVARDWLREYKSTLQCQDCGNNHPLVLDFHHRDEKIYDVSAMASNGNSIQKIMEEIDRCDVLCANCHRVLHGSKI